MKSVISSLLSIQLIFAASLDPEISMLKQINLNLQYISKIGEQISCTSSKSEKSECSYVLEKNSEDITYQGFFSLLVDDNPRDMCSGVQLTDDFFTDAKKLDDYYQKYTNNLVPSFYETNSGCLSDEKIGLSSLKDQQNIISYYYYANMRIANDAVLSLNSMAYTDMKLGRAILEDIDCADMANMKSYCESLKNCPSSKKMNLNRDVIDTSMALEVIDGLKGKITDEQSEKVAIGLENLYPWLNGKEFRSKLKKENGELNPINIESAIKEQLLASRELTKKRLEKHKKLSKCLNYNSDECDNFQEQLTELVEHEPISGKDTQASLIARSYEQRQSCIHKQRDYRDSANSSANDLLITSGITIATMGFGTIAAGGGHVLRSSIFGKNLSAVSIRSAPHIKNGAKILGASISTAMVANGVKDTALNCEEYLSHLSFINQTSPPETNLCPKHSDDPHFQIMSDYKSCLIESALTSIDFIPGVSFKVPEFLKKLKSKNKSTPFNKFLEDDVFLNMDPDNMKLKSMQKEYQGEEKGLLPVMLRERVDANGKIVPGKTHYIKTDKRREPYRGFISDGKLYDSKGELFNSKISDGDKYLNSNFVIDKNGNLFLHPRPEVGRIHHSTFLAGDDVLAAGELVVKDGVVIGMINRSGHYKPEDVHFYQGIYLMMKNGLDFTKLTHELDPKLRDLDIYK